MREQQAAGRPDLRALLAEALVGHRALDPQQHAALGRQLRRAGSSIALGVAEGMYSRGGNRAARYHSALGSARETMACLEVAVALGYIDSADPGVMVRLARIVATLVRLVQRPA